MTRFLAAAFSVGLCIQGLGMAAAVAQPAALLPPFRTVGGLRLAACREATAYCGHWERPLDPTASLAGHVPIYFEFYPHTAPGPAAGTLVATEGGPGYPATLSRTDYLSLFAPLRAHRDVLIMDNRGTGQSGALDCPGLQTAPAWTVALVGACGESLGPAAALYGTASAADDLAALLGALDIDRIDLYGDSYGTYFEQVFAVRHPHRLRSLVLDGAYPLRGPDYAWYPTYAPAMRAKFNLACARSAACAQAPGTSIEHVLPALAGLRTSPFTATAWDADGRDRSVDATPSALAIVMFASAPAFVTVREVDAAARAFDGGDRLPLLRLMAETLTGVDSRDPTSNPKKWSAGLAAAVLCHDPPQIYDMRLPPEQRAADRDRAIALRNDTFPETYAPFTIDEFRGMPLDYSFLDECVAWPVAPKAHPAGHVIPDDAVYPDVPALVISGELDDITTVADGAAVAHAFARGTQVVIANSFHVNALPRARSRCAADIARRFIDSLAVGDTRCATRVPPLRLVAQFARHADTLGGARPRAGNRADGEQLKIAAAAVATVGDVLSRAEQNSSGTGKGLRGGGFLCVLHGPNLHVSLYLVRWTADLVVSGALERTPRGAVSARLQVAGPDGQTGRLTIRWAEEGPEPTAWIDGSLGGVAVVAALPAP
jgi:pimeloyl-ACP methyl ester carboxylesterase